MFDTYITVCGNVLSAPEWRRTRNTKALVANFRVASTSRRFDRVSGDWVDGDSLRVRVNCWRRLAEGVAASVMVGDPVVVVGRLYSRDWTTENNERRVAYELEAVAVGHDLAKGRATFERRRPTTATSAVEDEEAENRVGGELSDPVADLDTVRAAARTGVGVTEAFGEVADDVETLPPLTDAEAEALGALHAAGLETTVPALAAAHTGETTAGSVAPANGGSHASGPTPTMPADVSRVESGGVVPDRSGGELETGGRPDVGDDPATDDLVPGGPAMDENSAGRTGAEVKTLGRRRRRDRQPVPA